MFQTFALAHAGNPLLLSSFVVLPPQEGKQEMKVGREGKLCTGEQSFLNKLAGERIRATRARDTSFGPTVANR